MQCFHKGVFSGRAFVVFADVVLGRSYRALGTVSARGASAASSRGIHCRQGLLQL